MLGMISKSLIFVALFTGSIIGLGTARLHALQEGEQPKAETAAQAEVDSIPQNINDGRKVNEKDAVAKEKVGYLISVNFPLDETSDRHLRLQIQRIIDQHSGQDRPIVALQFQSKDAIEGNPNALGDAAKTEAQVGKGTEFERALSLSRFLIGPTGVRARTIAYLPYSVQGHAVLVALACEEIATSPRIQLGSATNDEQVVDGLIRDSYLSMAKRRGTFPADAISAMIDRDSELYRIETTDEKTQFVSKAKLVELRNNAEVIREQLISVPGQLARFSGQEMRLWRWTGYIADDEDQLEKTLNIDRWEKLQLKQVGDRIAAVVEIRGAVNKNSVNRWLRVLSDVRTNDQANLIIFHIHSPGGDLQQSIRMADQIANLDDTSMETVAWIDGVARGDASIIAMACDTIILKPDAILGGPGEATVIGKDVVNALPNWESLAKKTGRQPSDFYAPITPDLVLHQFTSPRGKAIIAAPEIIDSLPDAADWTIGPPVSYPNGIDADEAIRLRLADDSAPDLETVAKRWNIDKLPPPKRIGRLEQFISHIASQDWLATLLLIAAFTLFTNELTTPGLGIAGFLSMTCFLIFFWMKFLNGTVEWLEVTLFIGGALALGLEMFVLPGFGIFGFGGFIMLATSLILASQTFIVPTNDYQWNAFAWHICQIVLAFSAIFVVLFILRDRLEQLPFFRWLKLDPPKPEPVLIGGLSDEFNWVGLIGQTTSRCAPYGRGLFDGRYVDICSEDGLIESNTHVTAVGTQGRVVVVRKIG